MIFKESYDVNEIIVKIEMKKFQKLIENRMQHKNALLLNDVKRQYPLCLSDGSERYVKSFFSNGPVKLEEQP